jgi:hypothetical protein
VHKIKLAIDVMNEFNLNVIITYEFLVVTTICMKHISLDSFGSCNIWNIKCLITVYQHLKNLNNCFEFCKL